jgi:hypothetical protein
MREESKPNIISLWQTAYQFSRGPRQDFDLIFTSRNRKVFKNKVVSSRFNDAIFLIFVFKADIPAMGSLG